MEEKLKYRYFITGRTGTRQVYPSNGQKLALTYTENDERLDYDIKISDKLKFIGDDFYWLYALEKTIYRCDYLSIDIEKYCSGDWAPFFSGKISLNSGNPWDLNKGSVELAFAESATYDCIDDGGDTDYNVMNYVYPKVSVSTITGTLEEQSFNVSSPNPGPVDTFPGEPDPYSKGWAQRYARTTYQYDQSSSNGGATPVSSLGYSVYVIWVRETISVPVATIYDAPWIEISNDGTNHVYARSPILYNPTYNTYDPSRPSDTEVSYSVLSQSIDNGLPFMKVVSSLLQEICPQLTLESEFFQWNVASPTNINYVTNKLSKVNNLVLFQKSDVKRPNTSNNATIATISFSDLISDICKIFQLKYWIDDNSKFRIEHVSYSENTGVGLDTTLADYIRYTAGNRSYSYDNDKVPNNETFKFMDISYGDFGGMNISYSGSCAGQGDAKDTDYNVAKITTDVQLCLNNPNPDSAVSDDGFVLIACDDSGSIIRELPILGGNVVNNSLAWAQLQRDYYRYNRPQKTFMMNGVLTTALSVLPTKLQTDFTIPFCCDVFDPRLYVKTSLGEHGTVKTASYDMYNEKLKLSILHPADEGLIENEAPITIGDTAQTFKNTPIIIDVLANDTDPDGYIDQSTLTILVQPHNGLAEITEDYKVKYTPNADYVGADMFIYNVKDNYKDPSPNTLVNITVKDGTPQIVANGDNYTIAKDRALLVPAPGLLANDTGPSDLTCFAETKPTNQGGTAQINSDGSLTYTPPSGFTGIDAFMYTAKDITGNTAAAMVNITVFAPSPVYVRLRQTGPGSPSSISEMCAGSMTIVGERQVNDYYLDYFSDSSFTTPLDVTNYGITVDVRYTRTDYANGSNTSVYTKTFTPSGVSNKIETNYETEYHYTGCNGMSNINYSVSLSLQPGSGYNI